jgi:two-component system sensor histidine kinase KdpD
VADTIINYARQHNITKVIAGKPLRPRWEEILRGSVVDQLIRQSGTIDVYIISGSPSPAMAPEEIPWRPHAPLRRYSGELGRSCDVELIFHLAFHRPTW